MKKYLFYALIILTALSCRRTPEAEISASSTVVDVNETITFTNNSENTRSYFWDFGDGTTSTEESPSKAYSSPGYYGVVMQGFSRKERDDDVARLSILVRGMEGEYEGEFTGFTTGGGKVEVERATGSTDITIRPAGLPSFMAEVTANNFVAPEQSGTINGSEYTISATGKVEGNQLTFDYELISSGVELEGSFDGTK